MDPLPLEFHGELKGYQQDAAEAVLEREFATLIGGHKSGKTVIALYTIAQRRQPTLVLIPKLDLLEGWLTKIENFLQIPRAEVGLFAEGVHQPGNAITIGHTGEVMRYWRKIWDRIGYLIMDECQRCPSKVLTHLIPNFDSRYMLGLSNTTQRRDRLSRLVYYYIGDMVYTIDERDAREGRGIIHAHVVARETGFEYPYYSRSDYVPMLGALMRDAHRTGIIADDIEAELDREPQPLVVLCGGEEQNQLLKAELSQRGIHAVSYGKEPADIEEALKEVADNGDPCTDLPEASGPVAILVTPQTLMQCFRSLNSKVIFLAVPLYFGNHLANALREMHLNGTGADRRLKIYDYVDRRIGLLDNYFRMRSYNYGVHPDVLLNASSN
jgi:superfamily II DNA or RNA helicase